MMASQKQSLPSFASILSVLSIVFYPLVTDTTCTYTTTLRATAIPTPIVVTITTSPLGTLHLVLPVDFMQVDPATNSLPLMLKCFTRQLKYCL